MNLRNLPSNKQLHIERLEKRQMLAADWQNPLRSWDVSGDEQISPLDVLLGINRINSFGSGALPARDSGSDEPFYDVNGDGLHSAVDVLLVINTINDGPILDKLRLANDSGAGLAAASDGVTNDVSLSGTLSGVNRQLLFRWEGTDNWTDATDHVLESGEFEIPSELVLEAGGEGLIDGEHRLFVAAAGPNGSEQLLDRMSVAFTLDRRAPEAPRHQVLDDGIRWQITFDEPINWSAFDSTSFRLFDATWGEADVPEWDFDEPQGFPRMALKAQGYSLSADGYTLSVSLPPTLRSTKYLVDVQGGLEDVAGNAVANAEAPWIITANYFSPTTPQLPFGEDFYRDLQIDARREEYQFEITEPDWLIWTGNRAVGSLTKHEIYRNGELYMTLQPNIDPRIPATRGSGEYPDVFQLEPGTYHVRFLDGVASSSALRIHLYSQLEAPPFEAETEPGIHKTPRAYRLDQLPGVRLFADHQDPDDPREIIHRIMDLEGRPQEIRSALDSDQFFDFSSDTPLIALVRNIAHRFEYSNPRQVNIPVDQWVEGEFDGVGQTMVFNFEVAAPNENVIIEVARPDELLFHWFEAFGDDENFTRLYSDYGKETNAVAVQIDGTQGSFSVTNKSYERGYRVRVVRQNSLPFISFGTDYPTLEDGVFEFLRLRIDEPNMALEMDFSPPQPPDFPYAPNIWALLTSDHPDFEDGKLQYAADFSYRRSLEFKDAPGELVLAVTDPLLVRGPFPWKIRVMPTHAWIDLPLTDGEITLDAPTGRESYRLEFDVNAGETRRYRHIDGSMYGVSVKTTDGEFFSGKWRDGFWEATESGTYVLELQTKRPYGHGARPITFSFDSQLSGPALVQGLTFTPIMPSWNWMAYRFTATRDTFVFEVDEHFTGSNWQVVRASDQAVLGSGFFGQTKYSVDVENGEEYFFILSDPSRFMERSQKKLTWLNDEE